MVRFVPEPRDIKQRIEHLIEQDYLTRDPEQVNTLNYVA